MQISIITALFNRLDLTQAYLASLEKTLRRWRYEVILIDDGSTDGTREFLGTLTRKPYRVVLNDRPRGFAANNNAGARLARAPLICLLNNDTVVLPGWLEPMARLASTVPDVAFVGNVQREPVSGLIDHYGVFFDHEGRPLHAGKNAVTPPREDYLRWPAVTAACWVARRKVFLDLGGFDETYRNGMEDIDLCLRAHEQGYRHFVANRSVIYHHVSASPGRKVNEIANFQIFQARWGERLQEWLAHPSSAGGVGGPRELEVSPRWNLTRRWKLGQLLQPKRMTAASIFLTVGNTVQNPSHHGEASVVRNLAGVFGRLRLPVKLVHWEPISRSLRLLPPEFSAGLDAERLRESPELLAELTAVPALFGPAAARFDDPFVNAPALHELPASRVPPPGTWIVLAEVPPPGQTAPLLEYVHRHNWRLAVVFHDALATNEPQFFPPTVPNALAMHLTACSAADLILPVSDFSAGDWQNFIAAKALPRPPVRVCKLAADTVTRPRATATPPAPPREPGAPIRLLCVSAVAPRKNHRALLAAFDLAVTTRPDLNLELCCVGQYRVSDDPIDTALHAAMEHYPEKVTWYEWVDYSALQRLYERCDFTIYPSVLEGFGLPIIESLWFRRPCICANFGAMDEVSYGGGCVRLDVRDPQALADGILALAGSPDRLEALKTEIDGRWLRCWEEYASDLLAALTDAVP